MEAAGQKVFSSEVYFSGAPLGLKSSRISCVLFKVFSALCAADTHPGSALEHPCQALWRLGSGHVNAEMRRLAS